MSKKRKSLLKTFLATFIAFSYVGILFPAKEVLASDQSSDISMNSEVSADTQLLLDGKKVNQSLWDIYSMTNNNDYSQDFVSVLFVNNSGLDIKGIAKSLDSEVNNNLTENAPEVGGGRYSVLAVPEGQTVTQFLYELNQRDDILIAEPAYERELHAWYPNDPNFRTNTPNQWQLGNRTDTGWYSIDMPDAWEYTEYVSGSYGGSSSVIVAVIDSGLAYEDRAVDQPTVDDGGPSYDHNWSFNNPYDRPVNLWVNTDETPNNGSDDDHNGVIDDYNGVNFFDYYFYPDNYGVISSEEGYPDDDLGHGTHVAEIIAGNTNNEAYGAGIAFNTTIIPIKMFSHKGLAYSPALITSAQYAMNNGADVINMSLGGSEYSAIEDTLFAEIASQGIISVASSGNGAISKGNVKEYPAGYGSVIAVGAVNRDGTRSDYSTYGSWIDLVAPVGDSGEPAGYQGFYQYNYTCNSQSTSSNLYPCTDYKTSPYWDPTVDSFTTFSFYSMRGTSFAAPQVAGVAALLKSIYPDFGINQIRAILNESTVDVGAAGFDNETGNGVLNASNALLLQTEEGSGIMVWSDWISNGQTPSNITMIEFDGRLYQAVRGGNTNIYTRSTADGTNWSSWVANGQTPGDITMAVFNGRLYQAVRGGNTNIYTRYTTDGTNWSSWVANGQTPSNITMTVFDGKLYQAVRGGNTNIYTRSTTDGTNWSIWIANGQTPGNITMTEYSGRLYQAVRGGNTSIYTRYTDNGTTWSSWIASGHTYGDVTMIVHDGSLYQAATETNSNIMTRSTSDGTNWSSWIANGQTPGNITMTSFRGQLYQAVRGGNTNIYTRYTNDGINWSNWQSHGQTPGNITMIAFNLELYQAVRGGNTNIYTRKLIYNGHVE
ncbi:S8 family serine peptidase [Candidatus Dojkabacteria bacterium]|nr:S8 family serine peptidase [Candidatus Dojkabacteria bacterium]